MKLRHWLHVWGIAFGLLGLAAWSLPTAQGASDPTVERASFSLATGRAQTMTFTSTIYMPLVKAYRPPPVQFSADFGPILITEPTILQNDFPLVQTLGARWVRVWLPWEKIETQPGLYDWSEYDPIFARLDELAMKPLPVIYSAPAWAAPESCGPLTDTAALENFLEAVNQRYGAAIEAWEFINEPDAREPYRPFGPVIGCWGLQPAQYATQLGVFYRKVKMIDPGALVLYGGLAYDNWDIFERPFFENTLRSGAGPFFDILSLHYYPINPQDFPSITDKISEVQEIMSRQGLPPRPIWITETSMWVNGPEGAEAQYSFITEELTRAYCSGADNLFWFAISHEPGEPPLHRWLIDRDHQPDNGYDTMRHYVARLQGTTCAGRYGDVPGGVEAYRFEAPDRSVYVIWSNKSAKNVTLPADNEATLWNRDGTSATILSRQNGQVSFAVEDKAVFVEIVK